MGFPTGTGQESTPYYLYGLTETKTVRRKSDLREDPVLQDTKQELKKREGSGVGKGVKN